MKKFDSYEFTGILAPGAVVVYGLGRIYPEVGILVRDEKISFGELGLLLILAYVAGHLVQSFGNLIELIWWKCAGGVPTDWIRKPKQSLIASMQREVLPTRIRDLLRIECPNDLNSVSSGDWKPVTRQIYAAVRKTGRADRVDIFNGNYGMFRGIAASLLVVLVAALNDAKTDRWTLYGALVVMALLALIRMHRFGVHYARELYVQFVAIEPGETGPPKKKEVE